MCVMYVCMCNKGYMPAMVFTWKPEDDFQKFVLCDFCRVNSVIRHGGRCLFSTGYLSGPGTSSLLLSEIVLLCRPGW